MTKTKPKRTNRSKVNRGLAQYTLRLNDRTTPETFPHIVMAISQEQAAQKALEQFRAQRPGHDIEVEADSVKRLGPPASGSAPTPKGERGDHKMTGSHHIVPPRK